MECSICLEDINNKPKFKLSCNHEIHYQCFLSLMIKTESSIFINCPLCRQMNTNNERPFIENIDNLKMLSKKERCIHTTKDGKRCKKKCSFLNNGSCLIHNKNKFPPEKYELLCDTFFYIIEASNSWKTKIYMMDISTKLIINNPKIKTVLDIQHYFFQYYHFNNKENLVKSIEGIYDYYEIKSPPKDWYVKCIKNETIF
mgnify:CR=1 FL=1